MWIKTKRPDQPQNKSTKAGCPYSFGHMCHVGLFLLLYFPLVKCFNSSCLVLYANSASVPLTLSSWTLQKRYQAVYSYTAAEADEVSLQEGDLISDVEAIDAGWMFGCNQRTGQRGLLPANYVRPVWDKTGLSERDEPVQLHLPRTTKLLSKKKKILNKKMHF